MFVLEKRSRKLLQTLLASYEDIKRKNYSLTYLGYIDKNEKLIGHKFLDPFFFLWMGCPKETPLGQMTVLSNCI